MARPLVGITVGTAGEGRPQRYGVNQTYVRALQAAGADVILLPPGTDPGLAERLDALLLPGGADVDPALYREEPEPELGELDRPRDDLELAFLDAAAARRLPVLAICRGIQVVNVHRGGTLHQHLANAGFHQPEAERTHLAHEVVLADGGRRLVNSIHHQGLKALGQGLRVTETCPDDGLVEGVESEDGLLVAVQCHPEELTDQGWSRALFEALVAKA